MTTRKKLIVISSGAALTQRCIQDSKTIRIVSVMLQAPGSIFHVGKGCRVSLGGEGYGYVLSRIYFPAS